MLIFIGSRRQTYWLRHMQRDERFPAWKCRTYAWLFRTWRLPAATYIFVGVDRLDPSERRLAAQFYRHINAQGPGFRALNDPAVAMGRYRLLRTLHERGINDFNAYLATEQQRPSRYPVFVRHASTSTPPLTGLLETQDELEQALDRLVAGGRPREDLLVIEYLAEPVAEGLFRKQAAYRIGDVSLPSPSIYAGTWYVKVSNTAAVPDQLVETYDRQVMADNPYAELAAKVFAIAGIEYGRADIGIVGGRPQIFEINFNPDLRTQREQPNDHAGLRQLWEQRDNAVAAALRAIDRPRGRSAPTLRSRELLLFRVLFWRNYAPRRY